MNFFDHKDLGNHLLQLCPKVVKHPVYTYIWVVCVPMCNLSLLFQKEEYEAYRASFLEMGKEVRKKLIKLRKSKK
jgi:hypothetical protein